MVDAEFETIMPYDRPDYRDLIGVVSDGVWPEFMFHDTVADEHWGGLYDKFADYQFALASRGSGAIAGYAHSVPLRWTGSFEDLPEEGWDWALIQSADDFTAGRSPTALCGLEISVAPGFQGQGLSRILLSQMVELARAGGLPNVIIPVRPSVKSQYPLTPMDRYIRRTRSPSCLHLYYNGRH